MANERKGAPSVFTFLQKQPPARVGTDGCFAVSDIFAEFLHDFQRFGFPIRQIFHDRRLILGFGAVFPIAPGQAEIFLPVAGCVEAIARVGGEAPSPDAQLHHVTGNSF